MIGLLSENTTEEPIMFAPRRSCRTYRVELSDSNYNPGESSVAILTLRATIGRAALQREHLGRREAKTAVTRDVDLGVGKNFPHYPSKTS